MQLKVSTDYAIRIVLYTAINKEKKERISSGELSRCLGIPQSVVLKLGRVLRENEIIDVTTGPDGGFKLLKDAAELTLFDIINIFEPTTRLNRCLEEDEYCSRFATEDCPVRKGYMNLQRLFEDNLKATTIQSLLDGA